ncbi:helix-turn-helix domain-containing protein [Parapedobacter tibetensis]|uniref:helix-turn-helix domain-containing protein n=1 Tax=Parapedobacter tibetensis TaxID=2972951 RepID=UPI00214D33EE|nr:helix-turn-helix transcriptional regulator [Parapedobacter tibetensis]
MKHIGKRIKDIREERGFTQDGVALGAKISQAALSKIENGAIMPKLETLERLAKSLKVDLVALVSPTVANSLFGKSLLGAVWARVRYRWLRRGG